MIDRLLDMIDKVPQLRQSAKIAIKRSQEKLARNYVIWHPYQFQKGEKVLYYDKAKTAQHHTKLEPR